MALLQHYDNFVLPFCNKRVNIGRKKCIAFKWGSKSIQTKTHLFLIVIIDCAMCNVDFKLIHTNTRHKRDEKKALACTPAPAPKSKDI